jgi:hypothetical protein
VGGEGGKAKVERQTTYVKRERERGRELLDALEIHVFYVWLGV